MGVGVGAGVGDDVDGGGTRAAKASEPHTPLSTAISNGMDACVMVLLADQRVDVNLTAAPPSCC